MDKDHIRLMDLDYVRVGSEADKAEARAGTDGDGLFGEAAKMVGGFLSPPPAHKEPVKREPGSAQSPSRRGTAEPTPAPVRETLPPAEPPVDDLSALPRGTWTNLATYYFSNQTPSKNVLEIWYGHKNCETYQRDRNDEFAMADHVREAKQDLAFSAARARVSVPIKVEFGQYDFDKNAFAMNGFPIGGGTISITFDKYCPYVSFAYPADFPRVIVLDLGKSAPWEPRLPMAPEAARVLVNEFKARNHRSLFADLVLDLGAAGPPTSFQGRIQARPVALYLWKDQGRRQFVAAMGAAKPGSENVRRAEAPKTPKAAAADLPKPQVLKLAPPQKLSGKAEVVSTGTLRVAGALAKLKGVKGFGGKYVPQLQSFIDSQGGAVACTPDGERYSCSTAKGTDVAEAALLNGAAETDATATARLREMEQKAKAAKRGVWMQ